MDATAQDKVDREFYAIIANSYSREEYAKLIKECKFIISLYITAA